jgi:hypothetical protein
VTAPRCVVLAFLLGSHTAFAQQAQPSSGTAFALHAGAAYARVPETTFETVGALSGQDLFAETSTREGSADFAVLVSQRLWSAGRGRIYATIGTGVSAPGRVLFFGGSVGASRTFFTAGVATASVDMGVIPVPDSVFRGNQDRTLFAGIEQERRWGFFAGVSFGLIQ